MEEYLTETNLSENVIVQKLEQNKLWIIGILLLLAGVAIGLLISPVTKGINMTVFSHNSASNSGDTSVLGMLNKQSDKKTGSQAE